MSDDTDSSVIPDIVPTTTDVDSTFWLHAASVVVRRYCGWHVTPSATLTGTLNLRGGSVLRLPARHVTAVTSLTDRFGNDLTPYIAWDVESGLVESTRGPFPTGVAAVSYRITAGWDDRPDVQGVVISMARRMVASTPAGITTSQSVNGSSASYGLSMLMQEETSRLAPYRLTGLP